ncbi:ribosomal protein S10 [Cylindrobasidium torrendii FP15055 ss-10]|uniref:Ribosomal protein S10 n=1 Tax=Cylindrobasidium torrendii FP15055 ss-10 TaxID=1314674 RepID=A0A0D7BJ70_9AGAR|nr:ribosomal protein S10 [Cylindrobasidium torrendii FP15055 ss-10]
MATAAAQMRAKMREMAEAGDSTSAPVVKSSGPDLPEPLRQALAKEQDTRRNFEAHVQEEIRELQDKVPDIGQYVRVVKRMRGPDPMARTRRELFDGPGLDLVKYKPGPHPTGVQSTSALELQHMDLEASVLPMPVPDDIDSLPEREYSASLVHGRAARKAFQHPITHGYPVALIHLRSYHPSLIKIGSHLAAHAAAALGIPATGVAGLPRKKSLWTVIKSPFVHKKSQENFGRTEHSCVIKAYDAHEDVVSRWIAYVERHHVPGTGLRVVRWQRRPLGEGKATGTLTSAQHAPQDKVKELAEKIVREEQQRLAAIA